MLPILTSELSTDLALAAMLLAILFAFFKGRAAISAGGRSLTWTQVPLVAFAIAALGPSAFAVSLYFCYRFGFIQPGPSGYRFSTFIRDLPLDFAVVNWGFIALYVICRLWPNFGSARSAMWASVFAMSLPNIALFSLAWDMVSNVFDAGQGIGVVLAAISFPIISFDAGFGIGSVLSALTAPIPLLGLIGWLGAQLVGWLIRE